MAYFGNLSCLHDYEMSAWVVAADPCPQGYCSWVSSLYLLAATGTFATASCWGGTLGCSVAGELIAAGSKTWLSLVSHLFWRLLQALGSR